MAFGDWHAYYNTKTGQLVSVGSDDAPASRGNARVSIPGRPGKFDVWNETSHVFEDKEAEIIAAREAERTEEAVLRQLESDVETEKERLRTVRRS